MNKLLSIAIIFSMFSLGSIAWGEEINADQRFFYLGAEAGLAEPINRKIRRNKDIRLRLEESNIYSGKIGYSFYPQIAIEFAASHQPKYQLKYFAPKAFGTSLRSRGKTKLTFNIYMLSLIYNLTTYNGFTPFITLGGGVAKAKVKAGSSSFMGREVVRISNITTNCPAWQVGIGTSKAITTNFAVDLAIKFQAIKNAKIKYSRLDSLDLPKPEATIKKTISALEFGIGFTYKIPV